MALTLDHSIPTTSATRRRGARMAALGAAALLLTGGTTALFADPAQGERLAKYHGDKAQWVLDAWIGSWLSPAFASWSLDQTLPQLRSPLLVIHGSEDEYGSPRHPERIVALAGAAAQLVLMPDTRHVPHREREAEVIERVTAFLQTVA